MARQHRISTSVVRRLRLSPDRFAAAAAVQDPNLVLQLQAARSHDERPARRPRRRSGLRIPRALAGETGGALLLVAAVALALLWSNSPWAGGGGAAGWGVAISTDTALALGALTIAAGPRADRLRAFMITLLVVDDVAALAVISLVYPSRIDPAAVIVAAALLTLLLSIRAIAARQFRARGNSTAALTPLSVLIGIALWLALFESGIDPVVSGLLIGLLTNAYEPRAHGPAAISPNDRLQHRLHPWTSKVVVPIFALANAGLHVDRQLLASAATSPITWGILLAYVVGKPLGIVIASCAAAKRRAVLSLSRPELRGTALSAGIGFTVSLLIASRAFHGAPLDQAKVGILATALIAPALAVAALAPRRGFRLVATSPCLAR
jgi:Na+/H+ antiporter NhaA